MKTEWKNCGCRAWNCYSCYEDARIEELLNSDGWKDRVGTTMPETGKWESVRDIEKMGYKVTWGGMTLDMEKI